jgi:hypothetical protein
MILGAIRAFIGRGDETETTPDGTDGPQSPSSVGEESEPDETPTPPPKPPSNRALVLRALIANDGYAERSAVLETLGVSSSEAEALLAEMADEGEITLIESRRRTLVCRKGYEPMTN